VENLVQVSGQLEVVHKVARKRFLEGKELPKSSQEAITFMLTDKETASKRPPLWRVMSVRDEWIKKKERMQKIEAKREKRRIQKRIGFDERERRRDERRITLDHLIAKGIVAKDKVA